MKRKMSTEQPGMMRTHTMTTRTTDGVDEDNEIAYDDDDEDEYEVDEDYENEYDDDDEMSMGG